MMLNDVQAAFWPWPLVFNTASLSSSTASAGQLSGAALVVMNNAGGTPGTYTTRTATQMIADSSLTLGQLYLVLLVNGQGTGTLTLAGGTGVTITGTATVATVTARLFTVSVTNVATPAITFTNQYSLTATALAFGA